MLPFLKLAPTERRGSGFWGPIRLLGSTVTHPHTKHRRPLCSQIDLSSVPLGTAYVGDYTVGPDTASRSGARGPPCLQREDGEGPALLLDPWLLPSLRAQQPGSPAASFPPGTAALEALLDLLQGEVREVGCLADWPALSPAAGLSKPQFGAFLPATSIPKFKSVNTLLPATLPSCCFACSWCCDPAVDVENVCAGAGGLQEMLS